MRGTITCVMIGDEEPSAPVLSAGSTRAMFDAHYAGVLADEAMERRVAAAGAGSGVGAGIGVDPAAYRSAIEKLTRAVQELEAGQARWLRHRSAEAIGIDPVSVQLRKNMDEMERRAVDYVRVWTEQVRDTRDALKAQLASYEAVEQRNAERLA